jgi:hypothetical protein
MSGHTSEPWAIFGAFNHIMGIEYEEAQRRGVPHAQWTYNCSEDDARRIVACVNACEGIPTGMLEAGDAEILAYSMRLKQQRDNLLAALKDIASRHRHRGTLALDVEEFIDIENLIAEIEASK